MHSHTHTHTQHPYTHSQIRWLEKNTTSTSSTYASPPTNTKACEAPSDYQLLNWTIKDGKDGTPNEQMMWVGGIQFLWWCGLVGYNFCDDGMLKKKYKQQQNFNADSVCLQYKKEIMSLCKQTSKKEKERRHQKVQNNSPCICPHRYDSQWTGCDRCNQTSPVLCCPVSPHHPTWLGWSYGTEAQHTMSNSFIKYTLTPKSIITTQWGLVKKSKPHLAIHGLDPQMLWYTMELY